LTQDEKSMLDYTRTLGNFRKSSSAIKTGKLMQYLPDNGLYVYFRYDDKQTVMCVMNTTTENKKVDLSHFEERTNGFKSGKDIVSGQVVGNQFSIAPQTLQVIELIK